MVLQDPEIDRLKTRRVTALYRLDLIAQGAQITYEDGKLVNMASEKARLEADVAQLNRSIEALERVVN